MGNCNLPLYWLLNSSLKLLVDFCLKFLHMAKNLQQFALDNYLENFSFDDLSNLV
jgi:hypothetical protein